MNWQLQKRLRVLGARDARTGRRIDAFYALKLAPGMRHTEAMRAVYEIGYRAEMVEIRRERIRGPFIKIGA